MVVQFSSWPPSFHLTESEGNSKNPWKVSVENHSLEMIPGTLGQRTQDTGETHERNQVRKEEEEEEG